MLPLFSMMFPTLFQKTTANMESRAPKLLDFLLKNSHSKDFVEKVAYAVESHVSEPNPETLEEAMIIIEKWRET